MYKRQIPVEDLRLGMYVVELDRAWLGTPFDFQGFPLTTEDQIDQCKSVLCATSHVRVAPSSRNRSAGFVPTPTVYATY